jgi:hypothetical protein
MSTVSLRFDDQMKKELEAPIAVDTVETVLDEADEYAAENTTRMTHEEVFDGLRRRVNG